MTAEVRVRRWALCIARDAVTKYNDACPYGFRRAGDETQE